MSIDYRTLLVEQTPEADDYRTAERILATRIPDLCPDCKGSGIVATRRYSDGVPMTESPCTHPNAPTIADLLRWGENVARDDIAAELPDGLFTAAYEYGFNHGADAMRAALRTEGQP